MLKSRKPFLDCKSAFNKLELVEDSEEWRIYWIACVTLLRAIGHVLDKIDSEQSTDHKKIIREHWESLRSTKPNPKIFWNFIEKERNSVLKQYDISPNYTKGRIVPLVNGKPIDLPGFPEELDFLMMPWPTETNPDGFEDGRDLISEALDWWDKQLGIIEREIAHRIHK